MHTSQGSKAIALYGRWQKIKSLQYLATCSLNLDYVFDTCTLGVDAGMGVEGGMTIPSILWPGPYIYTKMIVYSATSLLVWLTVCYLHTSVGNSPAGPGNFLLKGRWTFVGVLKMGVVMAEGVVISCGVCPLFGVANTLLCAELEAIELVLGVSTVLCLGLLMDSALNPTVGVVRASREGVLNRLLFVTPRGVVATEHGWRGVLGVEGTCDGMPSFFNGSGAVLLGAQEGVLKASELVVGWETIALCLLSSESDKKVSRSKSVLFWSEMLSFRDNDCLEWVGRLPGKEFCTSPVPCWRQATLDWEGCEGPPTLWEHRGSLSVQFPTSSCSVLRFAGGTTLPLSGFLFPPFRFGVFTNLKDFSFSRELLEGECDTVTVGLIPAEIMSDGLLALGIVDLGDSWVMISILFWHELVLTSRWFSCAGLIDISSPSCISLAGLHMKLTEDPSIRKSWWDIPVAIDWRCQFRLVGEGLYSEATLQTSFSAT